MKIPRPVRGYQKDLYKMDRKAKVKFYAIIGSVVVIGIVFGYFALSSTTPLFTLSEPPAGYTPPPTAPEPETEPVDSGKKTYYAVMWLTIVVIILLPTTNSRRR